MATHEGYTERGSKLASPLWKRIGHHLVKLRMYICPTNPAIFLRSSPCIYVSGENTRIFTAVLLIIANNWEQPTDEKMDNKFWNGHTRKDLTTKKMNHSHVKLVPSCETKPYIA